MANSRIKLCWKPANVVDAGWHLGLFGLYVRRHGGRSQGLAISMRGVLLWGTALTIAAYFTGAGVLWAWLDRRPYNFVTYRDLILPTHWKDIQKLRGQSLVAEGMADIRERKWSEGIAKLRVGIARNPDELPGRLMLADIFLAIRARKQAIETFEGGLAKRYPGRAYMEAMLNSAMQSENYEWALKSIDRALVLLGANAENQPDQSWLIQQKLAALIAADRGDEAVRLAESFGQLNSASINEYRVLALLKSGKPKDAIEFLTAWRDSRSGTPDQQIRPLLVRAYREAKDLDAMNRELEALRSQTPSDPRPYVYIIIQRLMAGQRELAMKGYDQFVLRFGSDVQTMAMLGVPLVEINEEPMLNLLVDHAKEQGFGTEPFRRFLVQVMIAKGQWTEAAKELADIEELSKKSTAAAWHEMMTAQVRAALDPAEAAQSNLISLIRGRSLPLAIYRDLVKNMRSSGHPETAREIITFAQGLYPQNDFLETSRKELDGEIAATRAATPVTELTRLTTTSSPASVVPTPTRAIRVEGAPDAETPIVDRARFNLTEAELFAKLDELTKAGKFQVALDQIREARVAKPTWLSARDADLLREEMLLNGFIGEMGGLRSISRIFINGDKPRSAKAIEVARTLHAAGRNQEALFVLNTILAKDSTHPVAKRLLGEWTPKPAVPAVTVPTAAPVAVPATGR